MALERQHGIVAHHTAAVVGYLDQLLAARLHVDPNAARTGIQRVFQQLLDHRSGAFHYLAGGNLVSYVFGENVDAAHDFKSNSPHRHRDSILVSSFKSPVSSHRWKPGLHQFQKRHKLSPCKPSSISFVWYWLPRATR